EYFGFALFALLCVVIAAIIRSFSRRKEPSKPDSKATREVRPWVDEDLQDNTEISSRDNEDDDWADGSEEMLERSQHFYTMMNQRRSVRFISPEPVPRAVVENVIRAAGTAPSGAPHRALDIVVVSDSETKRKIREIVEEEEEINYKQRMGDKWVRDLQRLRTNWVKEYLDVAPYLILVLSRRMESCPVGRRKRIITNEISVSISCGLSAGCPASEIPHLHTTHTHTRVYMHRYTHQVNVVVIV
uniref:iodotyrosine deiodinase n=1 Tax=Denticeps clupeoides TaxID=299321 RepID=A0AAY4BRG9_9TELE